VRRRAKRPELRVDRWPPRGADRRGTVRAAARQQQSKLDKAAQTAQGAPFSRRLRSNNSRKNIPQGIREPLAEDAHAIKADTNTLKTQLSCASSPG
jgi:hypothetical protein